MMREEVNIEKYKEERHMSFAFEIIQGEEKIPIKLGIYGAEGIGKTT